MPLSPEHRDDDDQKALAALYRNRAGFQPLLVVGNAVSLAGLVFQAIIACSLPVMIFLLYQLLAQQYAIREEVKSNTMKIEALAIASGITIDGSPGQPPAFHAARPAPGIPGKKARHESAGKSSVLPDRTPRERESSGPDPAR
jgi:hypothetical protein